MLNFGPDRQTDRIATVTTMTAGVIGIGCQVMADDFTRSFVIWQCRAAKPDVFAPISMPTPSVTRARDPWALARRAAGALMWRAAQKVIPASNVVFTFRRAKDKGVITIQITLDIRPNVIPPAAFVIALAFRRNGLI